ncbi:SulP family inorganic anion transporter [Argonema galeatum]|uniref:SulP family inorganic anion transporter n=1 Tax=Argonema galeatum TaxID=2942762 RepID=UPI0020129CAA|nr:sulfate permease [Argonema galeatum]MCL1467270.1 sulfate permease [Argonema galeatum A003/A1]
MNNPQAAEVPKQVEQNDLSHYLPSLGWLLNYSPQDLPGDLMAAVIVAIMLVPQSMAYSLLAGLPPQVGLYASILPLILYPLLGSTRTLAVGPVAMVSLLVATGMEKLADRGTPEYLALALTLAMLVGIIQLGMGLTRLGFLVNFLSHSVISGFTQAAALVIAITQLKDLMGITIPQTDKFYKLLFYLIQQANKTNFVTLCIGLVSIVILIYFNSFLEVQLKRWKISDGLTMVTTKIAPLLVIILGTLLVYGLRLNQNAAVKVVGTIPTGLPPITLPSLDANLWQALLPVALTISFVGFMESIAIAKSLASFRHENVDANQELVALGVANLGAAVTGGYPVTGGLSRSMVNFVAGANTGLASIISALLVALTVLFCTPLFYFLPQTSLAAIIIVAVWKLIDIAAIKDIWNYNKTDAASLLVTFFAVLGLGIENGILVGTVTAAVLYVWGQRKSKVKSQKSKGG